LAAAPAVPMKKHPVAAAVVLICAASLAALVVDAVALLVQPLLPLFWWDVAMTIRRKRECFGT
jgi:hypothetical protein